MRVLIFHGYLLQGTGSNVYNAELGAALVRAGHELHLVCQDRDPFALDWVDAAGDWDSGALVVEERRSPAQATVYRPDIAGLLPLYVAVFAVLTGLLTVLSSAILIFAYVFWPKFIVWWPGLSNVV